MTTTSTTTRKTTKIVNVEAVKTCAEPEADAALAAADTEDDDDDDEPRNCGRHQTKRTQKRQTDKNQT